MTERLVIGQQLLQRILEHCLEEKPYEACGILTGRAGRVLHAYATDNAKRSPVFYEVDVEHQEQVLREIVARGEELVGIYHSHPTAPAMPSLNDVNQAVHYPEAVRVIISLAGPTDIRAFLIRNGKVHDVIIAI
ncbi:MAG: Mov34/MPN/PAD-1 family protein, partial [Bacillota bacterium]